MVSSLVYVLYAISSLMSMYGDVGTNFAMTGMAIGAALLLLSALWHPVRGMIVTVLPNTIKQFIPDAK
jgi:succinate dehydrogenase hydrophobic anchor subunit